MEQNNKLLVYYFEGNTTAKGQNQFIVLDEKNLSIAIKKAKEKTPTEEIKKYNQTQRAIENFFGADSIELNFEERMFIFNAMKC